MRSSILVLAGGVGLALLTASGAEAKPVAPLSWCAQYPGSGFCAGTTPSCTLCHGDTEGPTWNSYGSALTGALWSTPGYDGSVAKFQELVGQAAMSIESVDHDLDGASSLEEIVLGTYPADAGSLWTSPAPPQGDPNPGYSLGSYDAQYAFRRVAVAYCGRNPTYAEMQALAVDPTPMTAIDAKLAACLDSAYWREQALPALAHNRIRPVNFGGGAPATQWDYRLWRYANSDGRDARDVVTAQYHVREITQGNLSTIVDVPGPSGSCTSAADCDFDQVCNGSQCVMTGGTQPCAPSKRAGMLTTTWFHFINTMFSELPRTTAAQAMRAHTGMDPAAQQALVHIAGEPADVDGKGVTANPCYQCHMAIDTSAYAFAYYGGIADSTAFEDGGVQGIGSSQYAAGRPVARGLWDFGGDRQAYFMDTPVADLVEWGRALSNSDYFARHHTMAFYRHATGREPTPDDLQEFDQLWQGFIAGGYDTELLIQNIVHSAAFGAP